SHPKPRWIKMTATELPTYELTAHDPTESRCQRGLAIAAVCRVTRKNDSWSVPSQSGQGRYTFTLEPKTPEVPRCTCKDYESRGEPCKHVYAVQYVIQREQDQDGSETVTESLTLMRQTTKPRKTYKQDWPAYNAAQTSEKQTFQTLLADLCRGIEEPAQ